MVGGDVVLHLEQHFASDLVGHGGACGEGLDVRAAHDLHALSLPGGGCHHVVVDVKFGRTQRRRGDGQRLRVGDVTRDGGDGRRLGTDEVDLRRGRSAASAEVAVEGAQRHSVGRRGLAHADAGAAGALQNARAGRHHGGKRAVICQHGEHLARTGGDDQADVLGHRFPLEDVGHLHHVGKRGVGAASDGHLIHPRAGKLLDGRHVVGAVGAGGKRHEC